MALTRFIDYPSNGRNKLLPAVKEKQIRNEQLAIAEYSEGATSVDIIILCQLCLLYC